MSAGPALLVALLLLLGNAFFVGAEFALVSARRTQIEPRAHAGSAMAKVTLPPRPSPQPGGKPSTISTSAVFPMTSKAVRRSRRYFRMPASL